MALKKFKPITPGQRHKINSDYSEVTTNIPEKSLVSGKKKSGGRNNDGRMTMRYVGGGHKKRYRVIDFKREIDRGTSLTFKMNFKETDNYVQSCYLDNRLGVWNALKVAENLENGIIVFSCWEEHGGGSVGFLTNFIHTKYNISQALISDITWVTEGVKPGEGVAISLRDSGIPRKKFVNKIIDLAKKNNISYQLEVESSGGSDGNEIQKSPFPVDWCFIGAAEQNVHSPKEKVHKDDIKSMVKIYEMLMKEL